MKLFSPMMYEARSLRERGWSASLLSGLMLTTALAFAPPAQAQDAKTILVVAGPRTPESLDQEYPPTEAVHELRRNVYEHLLTYAPKVGDDGVTYEDFGKIAGAFYAGQTLSPNGGDVMV
jgi:peptide/nickel transport system substrate-binding protein